MKEFDECASIEHGCSHSCVNTLGGYECACDIGYELHSDGKKCESKWCLKYWPRSLASCFRVFWTQYLIVLQRNISIYFIILFCSQMLAEVCYTRLMALSHLRLSQTCIHLQRIVCGKLLLRHNTASRSISPISISKAIICISRYVHFFTTSPSISKYLNGTSIRMYCTPWVSLKSAST